MYKELVILRKLFNKHTIQLTFFFTDTSLNYDTSVMNVQKAVSKEFHHPAVPDEFIFITLLYYKGWWKTIPESSFTQPGQTSTRLCGLVNWLPTKGGEIHQALEGGGNAAGWWIQHPAKEITRLCEMAFRLRSNMLKDGMG